MDAKKAASLEAGRRRLEEFKKARAAKFGGGTADSSAGPPAEAVQQAAPPQTVTVPAQAAHASVSPPTRSEVQAPLPPGAVSTGSSQLSNAPNVLGNTAQPTDPAMVTQSMQQPAADVSQEARRRGVQGDAGLPAASATSASGLSASANAELARRLDETLAEVRRRLPL